MQMLEILESRRMLSASPSASHGHDHPHGPPAAIAHGANLVIQGTKGNDVISVAIADATHLAVTVNGTTTNIPSTKLKHIIVNGRQGNDIITVDAAVTINAVLIGGPGNDTLVGGGGNDVLIAGPGTNTLTGGPGADKFVTRNTSPTGGPDTITDFNAAEGDTLGDSSAG
jgi:Ca2+-binding RTX toxin-like protein